MAEPLELSQPASPSAPVPPEDRTRRLIVWLVFLQFNLFVYAALTLTMIMQHQFSPAGENLLMIIVTGEIGLMGTAAGYFLGAGSRVVNGVEKPK